MYYKKEDYMADRNLVYSYNGKNRYDYESRNKEFNDNPYKNKDAKEVKANFNECINTIIIEPVVEINVGIRGLATSVKVIEMDEKMSGKNSKYDNRNNELDEISVVNEGVNYIVVKPKVKIDVNINELNTIQES